MCNTFAKLKMGNGKWQIDICHLPFSICHFYEYCEWAVNREKHKKTYPTVMCWIFDAVCDFSAPKLYTDTASGQKIVKCTKRQYINSI